MSVRSKPGMATAPRNQRKAKAGTPAYAETRRRIVDAAIEVFLEAGYGKATMDAMEARGMDPRQFQDGAKKAAAGMVGSRDSWNELLSLPEGHPFWSTKMGKIIDRFYPDFISNTQLPKGAHGPYQYPLETRKGIDPKAKPIDRIMGGLAAGGLAVSLGAVAVTFAAPAAAFCSGCSGRRP